MYIVKPPKIKWETNALNHIKKKIEYILKSNNKCSIMLTGGTTATFLYKSWKNNFLNISGNIEIYFTDERCVPNTSKESNYFNVMKNLYDNSPPQNHKIFPIISNNSNEINLAEKYDKTLPDHIDILILSLGDDGHIASLFKNFKSYKADTKKIINVQAPVDPKSRITITNNVLKKAKNKYLFIKDEKKANILNNALSDNKYFDYMSVRLLKDAIVFTSNIAYKQIKQTVE